METKTPQNAVWSTVKNGYDLNGKIISTTPQYDEQGNFLVEIAPITQESQVTTPTTTPTSHADARQNHSAMAQKQQAISALQNTASWNTEANAYTDSSGNIFSKIPQYDQSGNFMMSVGMENATDSNEDKNSMTTNIGSMATTNTNTENAQNSVVSSPATQSPVAGQIALTPLEQANKDYQDAVARGDYQGQINALTTIDKLNGEDHSALIADLTKQRQEKIDRIDNDYSNRVAMLKSLGYLDEANALALEQSNWRNDVGWADAIDAKYEAKQLELDSDYYDTYLSAVKKIGDMVVQSLDGIINFQYDPYNDPALIRAQAFVRAKMAEQAESTGMYYSSMVQGAIASAVADLVPVYQKMAREEAVENFKLLQSTANFLMDLEKTQFDLWKGQLEVKLEMAAEKRKEIDAAWDRVNELGYVDNQASAILNVPAGTLSAASRKAMTDKINEIEKEERKLAQDEALARFNSNLQIERMEKQQELNIEEYAAKSATDYEVYKKKAALEYSYDINKMREQNRLNKDYYQYQIDNPKATTTTINGNTKGSKAGNDALNTGIIDQKTAESLKDLVDSDKTDAEIIAWFKDNMLPVTDSMTANEKAVANAYNAVLATSYAKNKVFTEIDEAVQGKFGSDYSTTKKAFDTALNIADNYASLLAQAGYDGYENDASTAYSYLVSKIEEAPEFDYSWLNGKDNWTELRSNAEDDILKKIKNNKYLKDEAGSITELVKKDILTLHSTEPQYREGFLTNTAVATGELRDAALNIGTSLLKKGVEKLGDYNSQLVSPYSAIDIALGASNPWYSVSKRLINTGGELAKNISESK